MLQTFALENLHDMAAAWLAHLSAVLLTLASSTFFTLFPQTELFP